ncbi:SCO2400 family protein [Streptomyces sp. NPDC055663]
MDYCSSCRRTLNGALVCPGCGAYAPDIALPASSASSASFASSGHHHRSAAPATVASAGVVRPAQEFPEQGVYPDSAHCFDFDDAPFRLGTEPTTPDAADTPGAPATSPLPTTQGRAARRRQLARWKKHRRRAVLASTVALVGGGLTLAVLPSSRPSTGHDAQAAALTPEPGATAADRADTPGTGTDDATETDSSPTRPSTRAKQPSRTGTHPAAASGSSQRITVAVSTAGPKRTRLPVVAARPASASAPEPRTTPATAEAPATSAPAPRTTTPPAAPAADAPPQSPAPTATPPDQLCLLVICIG